jgi:hypothetical protein
MDAAPATRAFAAVPSDAPCRASAAAKPVDHAPRPHRTRPLPRPSLAAVRLLLAPALVFIATCLDRGYQTELWQHLARGRLIATEYSIVSADRFTFTVPGQAFRDNNWLWQLAHHALHGAGGLPLVQFTNSLVLAAAVALLVRLCQKQSDSTRVAGALGVVAFLGLWQTLLIRPQSVSMLLFVSLYTLLHAADRRPRLLMLVPPLMTVWANVHGGFAVGLVLISVFAGAAVWREIRNPKHDLLSRRSRTIRNKFKGPKSEAQDAEGAPPVLVISPLGPLDLFRVSDFGFRISPAWIACLVTSALATFLNPYGPDVYRYAGRLSALGVARGIEEWLPPSPATLVGGAFFLSLVAVAALGWRARQHLAPRDLCLLAVFAVPASFSVRMTVWWFLAAAPVAARLLRVGARAPRLAAPLAGRFSSDEGERPASGAAKRLVGGASSESSSASLPSWRAAGALVAIVSVCVASLPWLEAVSPLSRLAPRPRRTEADLAALVPALTQSSPAPRVFSRMEWSNYLAWATHGRAKVFVEGHVELYPDPVWSDFTTVNDARPGWRQVLDDYHVTHLVLDPTYHARLLSDLRRTHEWELRAVSGGALLFERSVRE